MPDAAAKFAASRAAVEKLHPGFGKHLSNPVYVSWGKIKYNQGSWVSFGEYYDGPYKDFIEPDDRIFFAGDHCSHINAWMEGAALSAHRALKMIADRSR